MPRHPMEQVPDPAERLAREEFKARTAVVRNRKTEAAKTRARQPVTLGSMAPKRERMQRMEAEARGYVAQAREVGLLLDPDEELPPGSVVLTSGLTGTAYQKLHSDGLYHSAVNDKTFDHAGLIAVNAIILYRAPDFPR